MGRFFIAICVALLIPLSAWGETVTINGRQFKRHNEKWYKLYHNERWEVVEDVISIKLKSDVSVAQLRNYNSINGVAIIRYNSLNIYDLKIPSGSDPIEMVLKYYESGLVEIAEPSCYIKLARTPNDPYYSADGYQWSLNQANDCDIDAPEAWDIEFGKSDVIIGILDTGTELEHPDLEGNIWVNPGEDKNEDGAVWDMDDIDNKDTDTNGYIDDICGWDFTTIPDNNNPRGTNAHGTHVAGIAGALTNNSIGIAGVAGGWYNNFRGVKLMIVQVWEADEEPMDAILDDAILYAAENGAQIINLSIYCTPNDLIDLALFVAHENYYIIFP